MPKPLELYDDLVAELNEKRAKLKDAEDELIGTRLLLKEYARRVAYLEDVLFRTKS